MVIYPLDVPQSAVAPPKAEADVSTPRAAWLPVAERQRQHAAAYWLVSQPDHARLSGDLAANFVSPEFPRVDPTVARAIGVHDAGWKLFESEAFLGRPPRIAADGKPLSFIEFEASYFLRAWTDSIDQAERVCAAGGIIVSRHFAELGDFRLKNGGLPDAELDLIHAFHQREADRQSRLLAACEYSATELDRLLEVLKFCDLLSLYLCSGARDYVEFTNRLTDRPVRVCWCQHDGVYRFNPSPFQSNGERRLVCVGVTARYFDAAGEPKLSTLDFLLA